ncbi:hypothetical protein WG947_00600 [Pontibacter sp. H259]|uniref:hypothetical protein n=1 Tax=Pontibacter sp. H259 TaxID=3133421 RepID=UPI0030BCE563
MYVRFILLQLLIGFSCIVFFSASASAQVRQPFTGNNIITVVLESPQGRYEFKSPDLLVRYNKNTEQLECSLLVNSLKPTSDTIPASMAYDVLYGAKFPELVFFIDVPEEIIRRGTPYPEPLSQRTNITLQGITNQTQIPVVFTADKRRVSFGTNFDLRLDNFEASIPARYMPVLTGRLLINIMNARWVEQF